MVRDVQLVPNLGLHAPVLQTLVLLAVLSTLLLTGCGFALRGTTEIPEALNPVLIQGGKGTATGRALIERLQGSQVRLTQNPSDARVIVRILGEQRSSRVAAVDRNGKVLARELGFLVAFDAVGPGDATLVSSERLTLERTIDNPDIEVLGKREETEMMYADMHGEAADRILLRLRAALR
jgi:LPS-assembly lipoprotein